ncbi:hypothetical protein V7S43_001334 [Phytophthora oleae]|uniref:Uncharacterized protein n=1 Tax=Phytophthora oleae TaxID=2107226 RepID=A0ABD3G3E6_9STRA
MKTNATQVVADFRQSYRSMRSSTVEEDRVLVKICEDQATIEKWPCLVTMTVCFLGLLFQQDHAGVGLSTISDRLIEAKKAIAMAPSSTTEASYNDVQRRVYDVVSVLGSCNMVDTSLVHSPISVDKCLRKHVRFNYDIFSNPRLLFAIPASAGNWNDSTSSEPLFDDMVISLRSLKSPQSGSPEQQLISPPLAYWQNLHDATALMTSPALSPAVAPVPCARNRDTSWDLLTNEDTQGTAVKCQPSSLLTPNNFARCPPQSPPRVYNFFSPFGMASTAKNEWYDESLKHLGLYDALPAEDKIDWELNKLFKENYREMWGYQHPTTAAPDHQILVDRADAKVTDLECRELLGDNIPENMANFFC